MNRRTRKYVGINCWIVGLVVLMAGCGKTQLEPHNIHLTASLRTAISTRNTQWLDQNIAEIEERRANHQMADEEYDAFQQIIHFAQHGEWERAEEEILALQKSQRPTEEQIQNLRDAHSHSH